MSKTRTDKSRYPSRYSQSKWVTAVQYIVELLCEQKAKSEKRGDLPVQFWQLEEWEKFFKSQVRIANKVLKEHGEKAVIEVIKRHRIWSLNPYWVLQYIVAEESAMQGKIERSKIEHSDKPVDIIVNEDSLVKGRSNKSKVTRLLEDLDF